MKRIIYFTSFLLCASLTLFSCQDDRNEPVKNDTTVVRVAFETPDFIQLGTRATDESAIKDITVLQFKNGLLVKSLPLDNKMFAQAVELTDMQDIPATTLGEDGAIVSNGAESFIAFIANVRTITGEAVKLTEKVSTYTDFLNYTLDLKNVAGIADLKYMPMTGFYYGGITLGVTNQINVTLRRSLAKVNFTLNLTNFKIGGKSVVTTVKAISLHNVPKTITFFPKNRPALPTNGKPGEWPSTQTPYPAVTKAGAVANDGGYNASEFVILDVEHNQTTGSKLASFTAYMPENARGSYLEITSNKDKIPNKVGAANKGTDDNNLVGWTYLLVDLDYETAEGTIMNVKYKIYLGGDNAGDMNLLANTQYNVTTYIYGEGAAVGTPNHDTRITVTSIRDPRIKTNTKNLDIQPMANSYIINPGSTSAIFTIPLTQARNGWRYIDNVLKAGGISANYTSDFDTEIAKKDWKIETLWRTWGSGNGSTNVEGAVADGITTEDNISETYYATLSFPTGANAIPTAAGNNCVIVLKDNSGKVWWSWHLWFTDYDPTADVVANRKGQTHKYFSEAFTTAGLYYDKRMMDRNLGATIFNVDGTVEQEQPKTTAEAVKWYGLMYQWGRKDPFTNSDNGTTTMASATPVYDKDGAKYSYASGAAAGTDMDGNSITADVNNNSIDGFPKVTNGSVATNRVVDAVRHPMNYYHSGVSNDWTKQDDGLWSMTAKTAFDPCPPGWRVPAGGATAAYNPWSGFGNGLFSSAANVTYDTVWGNNDIGPFPWFAQVTGQAGTAGRLYGKNNVLPTPTAGKNYYSGIDTPWYGGDVAWYPASGYRGQTSGVFTATGSAGVYWSCALSGTNASSLRFNSKDVGPVISHNRALGFPVRCVQHLLLV
ncbi:MAG: DUF4906 domain-containing protein [Mediterranea sp.]|jgi:hypothetical protein|nr:DUF4906 domain-containing protein [Mediterranea sp.]